jgi:hypothetical protein
MDFLLAGQYCVVVGNCYRRMTNLLLTAALILFISGCKDSQSGKTKATELTVASADPIIIGRQVITHEVAGSAYRKRAMGYFIVDKGDTSSIMFVFSEAKESGKINLLFREKEKSTITYRQKLVQLKKILPEAAKDFKIDSLNAISIGRLVSNGDIAVEVTEEFMKNGNHRLDNYHLALFIKDSRLAKDMNEVFSGYSTRVNGFSLEKTHFSSKDVLLRVSSIERDSSTIPEKIIDCQTWISFKSSR